MRISTSTYYQQAVSSIDTQQTSLSKIQQQMSASKRILTASDDPVAMGQVLGVNKSIADTAQWTSNANDLQTSLGLENTALTTVNSALQQIQTLALQANNASMSASDRKSLAAQMQQQLDAIVQQANAKDSSGRYLFGGTADGSAPFSQGASGVSYSGNSGVRMLSVGPTSEIAAGDPGDAVFMQLSSGDGNISVSGAAANAGSASVTAASVSDSGQYAGGSFTVSFSGGQYQVTDGSGATVASGSYTSGNTIQFGGVSLTLTGTPSNGDSFSVAPSTAQDLFSGVQQLINAVANPGATAAQKAQNQTAVYNGLQFLQGAQDHVVDTLSAVGSRTQAAQSVVSQLQSRTTQLKSQLSNLQDLDYAAATAQFSQTQLTLQAAEQSYVQVQGLSLFNYLK